MNRTAPRFVSLAAAALAAVCLTTQGTSAQTPGGAPPAPAAAAPAPPPPGDATRGKSAFMRFGCYECHGTVGQGNYGAGVRLAPKPLPYGALSGYVRRPGGNMPSFSAAILSDKDLADIYAYLSSIQPGKGAAQIPILNDTTLKPK
jgi:mono/diheme cytochrome c family protein